MKISGTMQQKLRDDLSVNLAKRKKLDTSREGICASNRKGRDIGYALAASSCEEA